MSLASKLGWIFAAVPLVVSHRAKDSALPALARPEIESVNTAEVAVDGVACERLDSSSKEALLTSVPARVHAVVESRGLQAEYTKLTQALLVTDRGRMNAFKASALARAMYLGGHEAAFDAKNVSLFLTKEEPVGKASGLQYSTLKLCFVDRTRQASFFPPHIYRNPPEPDFKVTGELSGVVVVPYDGSTLKTDKTWLPVDLLKLLDKKGLLGVNMDMAAQINIGDRSAFWAAKVWNDFWPAFRERGVDILFLETRRYDKHGLIKQLATREAGQYHAVYAFAYAELGSHPHDRIGPVYPLKKVHAWQACMAGSSYSVAFDVLKELPRVQGRCGSVAGAKDRMKAPVGDCKCVGYNMYVFCGRQQVADRKFTADSVLNLRACRQPYASAYCAESPCRPAHWA